MFNVSWLISIQFLTRKKQNDDKTVSSAYNVTEQDIG